MHLNNSIGRYRNYQELVRRYISHLAIPQTEAEIAAVQKTFRAFDRNIAHLFQYAVREAHDKALVAEEHHTSPFLERWSRKPPSFVAQLKARMGIGEFIHQLMP